jgi:RNA polymerase sigma factor for flagellar operon FliA
MDPFRDAVDEDFRAALAHAIDELPERERLVMSLYYSEELNLKEIGAVLKVTESRVCQLHGQALTRLKARLAGWRDEEKQD